MQNYDPRGLSEAAIHHLAPSVFAANPYQGVSNKYSFVPTARVVEALESQGWVPVKAVEQRIRLEAREGF
jgi:hypothetical protein